MKNLAQMMKQAQEMQGKMQDLQERLESTEIDGTSGAGMVTVTLNGKGQMRGLKVDPSLLSPDQAEVVEDLVTAAHNDAKVRTEEKMQEEMAKLTGGLELPPGFKLPF
jgi:DNA-binding YbaB/EbfC family protein